MTSAAQPDESIKSIASRHGFYASSCPSCRGMGIDARGRCGNCHGSGDLWRDGAMSLSDDGLLRLVRAFERERESRRTDIGAGGGRSAHV